MSKILIIDTAYGNYVGLICGDKKYELCDDRPKCDNYVEFVDKILKNAKLSLRELDAVAVNVGPGSFTGLRVGVTLAKGFSEALRLKIIPFTTFEAVEYNGCEPIIVLDGFSNFVYTNWPSLQCVDINELDEKLKKTQKTIISSEKVANKLQKCNIEQLKINRFKIVLDKFLANKFVQTNDVEPLYLRLSQAEIEKQKKEGKGES